MVMGADGLVWVGDSPGHATSTFAQGRDPRTGDVKRTIKTEAAFTETHHHRCYRNKATDRYILLGRTGAEFIDLKGDAPLRHCWVRGACQYGVMPANGLLYLPPHSCACYIQSKLSGFWALAPKRQADDRPAPEGVRLEKGPAYGTISGDSAHMSPGSDWPTHRHDMGRTGSTVDDVHGNPKVLWTADVGGKLTSPVIAAGKLLVVARDTHTLHALDAETGKTLWSCRVGAQVDSPPTLHAGIAVFGCADGFVYCLRASDGVLAWRFRAAPRERRIVARGQVESVWPVTGSVLVRDDVVYCTAGRSSFLDDGMVLCRLDVKTGELLGEERFYSRDSETGAEPEGTIEDVELPGALPDVLVCDDTNIYLRDRVLDMEGKDRKQYATHLYCSAGLLDDHWWHRTSWIWGERNWGRASGWSVISNFRPSGRILVTDQESVFGYGRRDIKKDVGFEDYHLFRADKTVTHQDKTLKNNNKALMKYQRPTSVAYHWSTDVAMLVRAMVLTKSLLWVAGPAIREDQTDNPFGADAPSSLLAVDIEKGRERFHCPLDSQPVFDGMVVANHRVFMSTVGGQVTCLQ